MSVPDAAASCEEHHRVRVLEESLCHLPVRAGIFQYTRVVVLRYFAALYRNRTRRFSVRAGSRRLGAGSSADVPIFAPLYFASHSGKRDNFAICSRYRLSSSKEIGRASCREREGSKEGIG